MDSFYVSGLYRREKYSVVLLVSTTARHPQKTALAINRVLWLRRSECNSVLKSSVDIPTRVTNIFGTFCRDSLCRKSSSTTLKLPTAEENKEKSVRKADSKPHLLAGIVYIRNKITLPKSLRQERIVSIPMMYSAVDEQATNKPTESRPEACSSVLSWTLGSFPTHALMATVNAVVARDACFE